MNGSVSDAGVHDPVLAAEALAEEHGFPLTLQTGLLGVHGARGGGAEGGGGVAIGV